MQQSFSGSFVDVGSTFCKDEQQEGSVVALASDVAEMRGGGETVERVDRNHVRHENSVASIASLCANCLKTRLGRKLLQSMGRCPGHRKLSC